MTIGAASPSFVNDASSFRSSSSRLLPATDSKIKSVRVLLLRDRHSSADPTAVGTTVGEERARTIRSRKKALRSMMTIDNSSELCVAGFSEATDSTMASTCPHITVAFTASAPIGACSAVLVCRGKPYATDAILRRTKTVLEQAEAINVVPASQDHIAWLWTVHKSQLLSMGATTTAVHTTLFLNKIKSF